MAAISSPLLDMGIERATGIVWNITGGADLTLHEARHAPFLFPRKHAPLSRRPACSVRRGQTGPCAPPHDVCGR